MNKNIFAVLGAALVLVGAGCQSQGNVATNANNTATTPPASAEGKVIISVTDAAADMSGVTSVQLTIDKIEMQSATKGWVTVSENSKTFDLLALKAENTLALAAETSIAADTYNQIRVHVNKIVVVKSGVSSEAKLPSNNLKINGQFTVENGNTTSVKLDFVADESLHITGNGQFIFSPVIKVEGHTNANVSVTANGNVILNGGTLETSATSGMDVDGSMKNNFKLETNANLEINNDVVKVLASTTTLKVVPKVKGILN